MSQISVFSTFLLSGGYFYSVNSYQLSVISYQLSVISYQLSVISYQLSVISYMLQVTPQQLNQIRRQAESIYPEECCGLLLGEIYPERKILLSVRETENSWNSEAFLSFVEGNQGSKRNRFSIAPEVLLQVQKEVRGRNLEIIGIYHSHPDYPAIPSEFDRLIAWSEYSYIIVSVFQGKTIDIRSWELDNDHQFNEEIIMA